MSTPEEIKLASGYLRGDLRQQLGNGRDHFDHDAVVLLKFHGIYQQDDRDSRRGRTLAKAPLDHRCMVRASVPGGRITPEQWLALDRLAAFADGSLRLTTRQGVQYHVTPKGSLHDLVAGINRADLTTLAACGDVVRNVMACPFPDERQGILQPVTDAIVARFRPQTTAYWELWVNGDKAVSAEPAPSGDEREVEPIYGPNYLPRKFKIALAWPGDNCVDVYSNDVGIVPTLSQGDRGELTGWVVLAGGGLGMSLSRPDDTCPRLATPLAWVPAEDGQSALVDTVEAVVTTQRDHGNRTDRHRARLKYLVEERGIAWLRGEVEGRLGRPLADPRPLARFGANDHHGWYDHGDGTSTLGLPIASGRVHNAGGSRLRTALAVVAASGLVRGFRVTPRQDLLLGGIPAGRRDAITEVLADHGVATAHQLSPLRRLAVACPALPTCGQALGEAERVLADLVAALDKELADAGLADQPIRLNLTGCPNGCARPYTAEIGIVGRTKSTYDLYLGGLPGGDRLAELIRADVTLADLPAVVRPVLAAYARSRQFEAGEPESLGAWSARQGAEAVTTLLPEPIRRRRSAP
jgi:sulfite reductase (ferredoxin)